MLLSNDGTKSVGLVKIMLLWSVVFCFWRFLITLEIPIMQFLMMLFIDTRCCVKYFVPVIRAVLSSVARLTGCGGRLPGLANTGRLETL